MRVSATTVGLLPTGRMGEPEDLPKQNCIFFGINEIHD
jgi:hypothetical protein